MSILRSKHSGWTWEGRRTPFGGSGGGPTSSTTVTSNIPEYARPYVTNMFEATQQQLFNTTKNAQGGYDLDSLKGYTPYSTDVNNYIAGFSPLQQQAQFEAGAMQQPGQFALGSGLTGSAGIRSLGVGNQYAQNVTSPQSMQAYMSPYQQAVTNVAEQGAIRDYQTQQNAQNLGAARQGTYGGARQLLANTERERNLNSNLANIRTQGAQSAYDRALQSQQFGATLGMQGYGQALGAGAQLGQLGATQQGADIARQNQMATMGGQQQALEQQKINQAIQDYATQQQYPLMQLGVMSNMLRGLPMEATNRQTYVAQPSPVQQVASLGGAALSYLGKREGGTIKGYREGGITQSYALGGRVNPESEAVNNIQMQLSSMDVDKLKEVAAKNPSEQIRQMAGELLAQKEIAAAQTQKSRMSGIAAAGGGLFDGMGYAGGGILAFKNGGYTNEELEEIARGYGVFPEGSPALPGGAPTSVPAPATKKAEKKEEPKSTPARKEPTRADTQAEYDAAMEKRGFGPGATKSEEESLAFIRSQQADTDKIQRQKEKANIALAILEAGQDPQGVLSGAIKGGKRYIEGDVAIGKEMEERKGKLSAAAAAHETGMRARAAGDIKTANEMFAKEAEIRKDLKIANIQAASSNVASNLKMKQMDAIRSDLEAKLGRKPTETEVLSAYTAASTPAGETAEARARVAAQTALQKWRESKILDPEYNKLSPEKKQEAENVEYQKILNRMITTERTAGAPQQAAPAPASVSVAGKTYNRKDYPQMTDEQWAAYVRQTKG